MPRFLTRHSEGFLLTEGGVDPTLSPYAEGFPDYPNKVAALRRVVNVEQFLWAIEATRCFPHYEMSKPVEWEVSVSEERVIGYIDDELWFAFVEGRLPELPSCFSKLPPACERFSVLLPFPLNPSEVLVKRVYCVKTPDKAFVVSEEAMTAAR